MDDDIIADTKQKFSVAWRERLPSNDLPSLDFLNDSDQAYRQFRHSIEVLNDCLATIKLEVFIVKFLRTHILSERKCSNELKVGFNIDEVLRDLESIFSGKTRPDKGKYEGKIENGTLEDTSAKGGRSTEGNKGNIIDKTSTTDTSEDSVKRDNHDGPNEKVSKNSIGHDHEPSGNVLTISATDNEVNDIKKSEGESNVPLTSEERPSTKRDSQTAHNGKVTIFTPISNEHVKNKTGESKSESSTSPNLSPVEKETSDPCSSPEKASSSMARDGDAAEIGERDDDVRSSGNELDNTDTTFTDDPFSSCSNSPDPVHEAMFLQDGDQSSDEILKIMPYSARTTFYSVDPSLESTNFGMAEHIYEDIDRYRARIDEEYPSEARRHLSQSEMMMKKTFSVGALRKDKIQADDEVFVNRPSQPAGDAEKVDHNTSPQTLSVSTNPVHKRSSSDAGVSYNVRPSRDRKAVRNKNMAFQIIDQHSVSIADGRKKNIQSVLEQAVDDEHKLHMRKWVVAGLVDSERGYLEALEKLTKPMKPIKASLTTSSPLCTVFEFHRIYDKVEELYKMHSQFLVSMEERISNWSLKQIIGDLFTLLMDQFPVYEAYIRNNKYAMETIEKCKSSDTFKSIFTQDITLLSTQEITTYESLFRKPLERIARYILAMDDLIKYTPEEHPDYEMLQTFMKHAQEFLERNYSQRPEVDGIVRAKRTRVERKLFKDAFVVELVDGQRKFRHLFLFQDVFVSAKLKVSNRAEQYAIKWCCSLHDILFYPTANSESAQTVPVTSNIDIDNLKAKIAAIKADIRSEQGMCEGVSSEKLEKKQVPGGRHLSTTSTTSVASSRPGVHSTKSMDRLKRKLAEQEAALWLALPSLPLTIYRRSGKTHRFLFSSDVARGDWKREISTQQKGATASLGQLSPLEIQELAETCLEKRTIRSLGSVNLKDDDNVFTGVLYVVVNSGKGFFKQNDCYVVLEVDYYGHYVRKARTKICKASQDPLWEEGFHIEVEGTQFIRVLCYNRARMKGDELCGQGTIKLQKGDLENSHYHDYTVILDKQGCIMVSIQYSTTLEGIHHRRSVSSSGVFGVSLDAVVKREKSEIPLVVIACCNEIERRGIDELGIYRVSGVSSDVRRLKEKFDENSQEALVYISEADIHAVAGTLKQYFRELPDPLFTANLYHKFTESLGMTDEQEKEKHLLDLLDQLPPARKSTTLFLIEHLRRVSQSEASNKMSLGNLATIFGPNLLRPPPKEKTDETSSTSESIAMEMASGTFNVMSQTSIFYWYLRSKSSKVNLPATPEITRRLFPSKKEVVIARLSSQSEDKLI
ncbi:active breakpoint cluster region-related protein-like [Dendronephthya gigantea]|uniref:active breakpoint cluster region-related protein-like n=1 Tax=Dendronephthya gigantea TaxID=151771 RepID=UPI001068D7E1|nr:active breakpoint cluster region-related protein-like [Dendronephthya gigantea]